MCIRDRCMMSPSLTISGAGAVDGAPGRLPSDVHRLEALLTPVDDEHAESLLHPHLDVSRRRRVAACHLEFLAGREHLLDGCLPTLLVEDTLPVRIGARE